ncbi:hypothetical protein KA996_01365 [bacterium]|jgi:hypothetical protein|nr:hypothetical protein [bacterium]
MKRVLIPLMFVLLFVSCGGEKEINSSSVQGIWKEMFVEITDTCEGQNESSTPSEASFIKIVLTAGDLLEVYHLYECEEESYDSCIAEDMWGSGSVFEDSSILVFSYKDTDDLSDLEWESDDRDCQLISQEELIINFEDGDDAELVMTASYKTTGKDCDSEVVNDYLNGDYGSLNYKDCSYKEIVQIKKVGDVEEE